MQFLLTFADGPTRLQRHQGRTGGRVDADRSGRKVNLLQVRLAALSEISRQIMDKRTPLGSASQWASYLGKKSLSVMSSS